MPFQSTTRSVRFWLNEVEVELATGRFSERRRRPVL